MPDSPVSSSNGDEDNRTQLQAPSMLRSFTRLAIGSFSIGYFGLKHRLQEWEARSTAQLSDMPEASATPTMPGPTNSRPAISGESTVQTASSPSNQVITVPSPDETEADRLRYAMIGAVFDAEQRLGAGLHTLDKATRVASALADPWLQPIARSHWLSPFRRQYARLVHRGQAEVDRWTETGRLEYERSRTLAQIAVHERVDNAISSLASNHEIEELVTAQSAGLANEVVEEVRERTVSGDNFLEGVVRSMLGRPSHDELPEPPAEVKKQALPLQKVRGRVIRK